MLSEKVRRNNSFCILCNVCCKVTKLKVIPFFKMNHTKAAILCLTATAGDETAAP